MSTCESPGPVIVLRPQLPRRTGFTGDEKSVVLNQRSTVRADESRLPVPIQFPYSETRPPRLPNEPLLELAMIVNGRPVWAVVELASRQSRRTWRRILPPDPRGLAASTGISGIS